MSRLAEKAEQLYIFAFPLIATEVTHYGADDKAGLEHFRTFPDDKNERIVKMNMDTLYSLAWTQLANTPYAVHIPKIEDRYYLFPIMDAYTNVVESIGTRTPEKAEGDYILLYEDDPVPEGYENYQVIRLENSMNSVLLRIETRGKKDYDYINKIQDQFEFRPVYPEKVEPVPAPKKSPARFLETVSAREFFTLFDKLAVVNPIRDAEILGFAKEFGIGEGTLDFDELSADMKVALEEGAKTGFEKLNKGFFDVKDLIISNGWASKFKDIGTYGTNYLARASTAYHGWGANIPEDSAYASISSEMTGKALDPTKKYRIRFEKDGFPHASFFWSLTLYGSVSQYPVKNKLDRFAINTYDVNDGLVELNEDGSLDIIVSKDEPTDPKEKKNWLPAPTDEPAYSLAIRIYCPDEFTLQGKWTAPVMTEIS